MAEPVGIVAIPMIKKTVKLKQSNAIHADKPAKVCQSKKNKVHEGNLSCVAYTIKNIVSITTRTNANVSSTGSPPGIDKIFAMV